MQNAIKYYSAGATQLVKCLPELLTGAEKIYFESKRNEWMDAGVPEAIATNIALSRAMYSVLNILKTSTETQISVEPYAQRLTQIAKVYFALADRLHLDDFREMINDYPLDNHWMVLARSSVKGDLDWHQRFLTLAVLKQDLPTADPMQRLALWLENNKTLLDRWDSIYAEMKASTSFEYSMLVVGMRELLDMARVTQ